MNKLFFILLLILAVSLINSVHAIRISPDSVRVEFQPGLEQSVLFRAGGAPKIQIYKRGALADYVSFNQTVLEDDGYLVVTIKLPGHIDTPGDHIVFLGARESIATAGTVGGTAAIQTPIVIRVPYPGIYTEIGISLPDASVDETVEIQVTIRNLGTDNIKKAVAYINIFNSDNILAKSLTTDEHPVESRSSNTLSAFLNTSGMKAGTYRAGFNITYDDNYKLMEKNFKIGALSVNILNYTKEFLKDKISKFEIEVQSKWNSRIDKLYAEVTILNSTKTIDTLKTPTAALDPWQTTKLSTFWDTTGLAEGKYNAKITIHYADTSSTLDGEVIVLKPQENFLSKYINTTTILITFAALLIIFNVIILLKRKRKEQSG